MNDIAARSASPRRIRQANEVAALEALYRHGRLSRAELARVMGLNRSSSGHIIAELTAADLVRETARAPSTGGGAGRPGILLELNPEGACFLGVEIGVEHIATARIDLATRLVTRDCVPFEGGAKTVDEAVETAITLALADFSEGDLGRCAGMGLSAPAQMDDDGYVSIAPILGWRQVQLADLARRIAPPGLPVLVENDANAFAIGATYRRRAENLRVTLFLVIESGVGGGIVIDGKLFRGGRGLAGEIGHLLIPDACEPAGPGIELEHRIGRGSLMARYRRAADRPGAQLDDFLADVRARAPVAVEIAESWARHLAYGLVQACRLIDPDRIVLGGSVAGLYPLVAACLGAHMRDLQAGTFPLPEIVVEDAPETGAAIGAACMVHQRFFSLHHERYAEDAPPPPRGAPS